MSPIRNRVTLTIDERSTLNRWEESTPKIVRHATLTWPDANFCRPPITRREREDAERMMVAVRTGRRVSIGKTRVRDGAAAAC